MSNSPPRKPLRKCTKKREYIKVTDEQRLKVIGFIDQNMSIKDSSDRMGINFLNAKKIIRVYNLE